MDAAFCDVGSDDDDSSEAEGDIRGIIEADGLALEERPLAPLPPRGSAAGSLGAGSGANWHLSVLTLRAPRPAVVEDEDGDLVVARPLDVGTSSGSSGPRSGGSEELTGMRIELLRLSSSSLARVGLQLWAGALVLSDLLIARPEIVKGRRVCELGAGLGLCSLLAARLGAASVLCSDGSEEAVRNCVAVLERNGADSGNVQAAVVRWEQPPPRHPAPPTDVGERKAAAGADDAGRSAATATAAADATPAFSADKNAAAVGAMLWEAEVLLAADVVYDAAAAEAFAALVDTLLRSGSARELYLALEKRVYFSAATLRPEIAAYPQFLEDCERRRLTVKPVDLMDVPVHFDYVRSRFYELVLVTAENDPDEPGDADDCAESADASVKRRRL